MKNAPPASLWEALRRIYACNQTQLAARLDISTRTLRRWERGELEAPPAQIDRARDLLRTGLSRAWPITDQPQDN